MKGLLLLWVTGIVALTALPANLAAQTAAAATQTVASNGPRYDVTRFGAVGNDASTTGQISATSNILTVNTTASTFVQGQGIYVAGAGPSGAPLITTISYISGLTFTLAAPASTTVGPSAAVISDDTAAIQTAFNTCWNFGQPPVDGVVQFPGTRTYLISSTINAYSGCKIEGNEGAQQRRYWPGPHRIQWC